MNNRPACAGTTRSQALSLSTTLMLEQMDPVYDVLVGLLARSPRHRLVTTLGTTNARQDLGSLPVYKFCSLVVLGISQSFSTCCGNYTLVLELILHKPRHDSGHSHPSFPGGLLVGYVYTTHPPNVAPFILLLLLSTFHIMYSRERYITYSINAIKHHASDWSVRVLVWVGFPLLFFFFLSRSLLRQSLNQQRTASRINLQGRGQ